MVLRPSVSPPRSARYLDMTKRNLLDGASSILHNRAFLLAIVASAAIVAACNGGVIDPGTGSGGGGNKGGNAGKGGGNAGSGGGGPTYTMPSIPDAGPDLPGGGNCGDGIQQRGETCDDGNTENNDGCNRACQLEANWECPEPGKPCNN